MYMRPSQISFFVYYLGAPSDQLYRLLYGGPSDQFFHLLYGAPLRLVSVLTIWGPPQISFCGYYMYMGAPSGKFLRLLQGAPSDQLLRLLCGAPPQVSFFAYYIYGDLLMPVSSLTMWAPLMVFLHTIWGPIRSVSYLTSPPPQVTFFAYYMGAPLR